MKSADKATAMTVARKLAPQFFAEGHERVYVAWCCGRVLVVPNEVELCRSCQGVPEGMWLNEDNLHSETG